MYKKKSNIWHLIFSVAVITVSFLVSGCAIYLPDSGFSKEVRNWKDFPEINRVALLDVPISSKIWLGDPMSDTGAAEFFFGILGAAVAASHSGDTVIDALSLSKAVQKEMQDSLEQAGFEVILLKAERQDPSKMLKDYGQFTQVDADVILEVAPIHVCFMGDSSEYDEDGLSPNVCLATACYQFQTVKR